ncbi:hypothetical protein BDV23DRAFT_181628 [Aspergillus alliaceus]|uniref:Uncharacterized protein n=1 Tax=Petromyces alliaceus TaxID=209559 RepID=A0A5N7CEB0_PETAA|nr:hypothetical protein BDV23DRAFT_181628 [Aspergillus alliaceus]
MPLLHFCFLNLHPLLRGIPHPVVRRRDIPIPGHREENLSQHPAKNIHGFNIRREFHGVPEGGVLIVALLLAKYRAAPVIVPGCGDEDADAGALGGAEEEEEQELAFEL